MNSENTSPTSVKSVDINNSEIEQYNVHAKNQGLHSKLGKFYTRMATERKLVTKNVVTETTDNLNEPIDLSSETPLPSIEEVGTKKTEIEQYNVHAKNQGLHSKLGKFYTRMATERELAITHIVTEIIDNSNEINFSFNELIEIYQEMGFSKKDLLLDLLEAGEGQMEENWHLEDIIIVGAIQMGSVVGLF